MKKENNLINFKSFSKALIIFSMAFFSASCEKEDTEIDEIEEENNLNTIIETYRFQDYSYVDNITCYDRFGEQKDSLFYVYPQDDFVFNDEDEYPYDKIEIHADSTLTLHYTTQGLPATKKGAILQKNDTLYFYTIPRINTLILLFKGIVDDNQQLKLHGYGRINYHFVTDSINSVRGSRKHVELGTLDTKYILSLEPVIYRWNNHIANIQNTYLQKFDLVYEIETE